MINHAEAQSLISARQDAPLDPIVARELDAHLATCPQCRAFATSTQAMTRALQELPHLSASPQVRRNVLEAIQKPVSPWNRVQGYFAPSQGFAWSTVAAVALVAVLSVLVATRLLNNPENDPGTNLLQAPSISATATSSTNQQTDIALGDLTPTQSDAQMTAKTEQSTTVPPTNEPTATENVAGATEEPTRTEAPPTDTPTEPAPTETPAPVEPTQPVPTATTSGGTAMRIGDPSPAPTEAATEEPTEPAAPTEVPTETFVPTETPVSATEIPTETQEPATEVPTETDVPPTELPIETEIPPTPVPTETPAPTQAPTEASPRIEPVDGTYQPTESGDGTGGVSPTVEESPVAIGTTEPDTQVIVPAETPASGLPTIGPKNEPDRQERTPSSESLNGGDGADPGTSLGAVDPGTQITAEGNTWAPYGVEPAPQVSASGIALVDDGTGSIMTCTQDGTCQPLDESGNRRTTESIIAIGWVGEALIVERGTSDGQTTYSAITFAPDGTIAEEMPLGNGDASTGSAFVFGDGILIETNSGWFVATATSGSYVESYPPVSDRQIVRLYPDRGFVGSIEDGRIVFENVGNGAIIGAIDTTGIDFDLSEDNQVAVSTGSAIEIWDLDSGSLITTYTPPSGDEIGSVTWLADGSIAYVDTTTGEVRNITPGDFGPAG